MTSRANQPLFGSSSPPGTAAHRRFEVCDCRSAGPQRKIGIQGKDYNHFMQLVKQHFSVGPGESFVVSTVDRKSLNLDRFAQLPDGSTLYLFQRLDQPLQAQTKEPIKFVPHYKTLTEGGLYEYYNSEGQNPLSYALAELIDNAISATKNNSGVRTIEIRMMFDDTLGKPAVLVVDNGCGMTSKQLNNWAVYRLSKFQRANSVFESEHEGYVRPSSVPRSLNSDVSYFGVGGKQASFFIGNSVRMISKARGSLDVHELLLSKEDFEKKERNKEDIYSTHITNRKPGDFSHVNKHEERFLQSLIREETTMDSFTAVIITEVRPEHICFIEEKFKVITRQLAHIYHYYVHGVHGVHGSNLRGMESNRDHPTKVDIQVTFWEKSPRSPRAVYLREVEDDMQTLFINRAVDTFEFKAQTVNDGAVVEGILRYHPFLYDRETYPQPPDDEKDSPDDVTNNNEENEAGNQARGKRSIFECYWNGRLIPKDTGFEFNWCTPPKSGNLPVEVYSRFSGVLFTNDTFKVTSNKLSFMNLEVILKNKDTIFTRVNGQRGRADIKKEFPQWLEKCHKKYDKQIKFAGFLNTIKREDVSDKKRQFPWHTFTSIQWDGKTFKKGQQVKTHRTNPILHGTVVRFLLFGMTEEIGQGAVFATGGEVELVLEPKALYDRNKIVPISKIDRNASDEAIQSQILCDLGKLPDKLKVDWPEGNSWPQNAVRTPGTALGPIKVKILNKKGESVTSLPSVDRQGKKLKIMLKITLQGKEVTAFETFHANKWDFWFKKNESLTKLGNYILSLSTVVNDSNSTISGGLELPSYKLHFTIKAGSAHRFLIDEIVPVCVGVPFDILLRIKDAYNHDTQPPPDVTPIIKYSGQELRYENAASSETTLNIQGVKVKGKCSQRSQTLLKVTLPGLSEDTQSISIVLHPGRPHSLHVTPEENRVENRNPIRFKVEVHDEAGNITANPKQIVHCEIAGQRTQTDCSKTGTGVLVTRPINLKVIKGQPQMLQAQFVMPGKSDVAVVALEVTVLPSTQVSRMEIFSDSGNLKLKNEEKIEWPAGGVLDNLSFKLYDEADQEVALTENIASRIKVNWTAEVNLEDLVQGKLPDLLVPNQAQEERFYQASYQDQNLSISFSVVPRPNEAAGLRVVLPQDSVKLGNFCLETSLVDQFGNLTKTLNSTCVSHMSVEAEGLDQSAVTFTWQESNRCALVKGVQFQSGTLGPREMHFTYLSFKECVIIRVRPGVPAELKLISGPEQPLQVLNGAGISTPFLVQLCDRWGNASQDERVVIELTCSPQTLKVSTDVTSQPVDREGKASFVVTAVSGPKGLCSLLFKCSFNEPIPGPTVNLIVIADPKKPVKLSVSYNKAAKFPAGGKFPVFSVSIQSEEGNSITALNPADISMLQWKGDASAPRPPPAATRLMCSKPLEGEKNDCFHFRDKDIPEQVGNCTIQFRLQIGSDKELFSDQIRINVEPNQPVRLDSETYHPTPVVSGSRDVSSRTLVENMTLLITDKFENPTGRSMSGRVVVSIKNSGEDRGRSLPLFEGKRSSCAFSLAQGRALIPRLAIMENSPGENGFSYVLHFKPEVPMVSLDPFELQFRFCNDVKKRLTMSELTTKKVELTDAVKKYESLFNTHTSLLSIRKNRLEDAVKKEDEQKDKLMRSSIIIAQNVSLPNIRALVADKTSEAEKVLQAQRVCSISDQFRGQPDVLGKVGHLALVEDDVAAWVISWHMRGDMDCVVTTTTEAAQKIYRDTQGRQEVLPLDSVKVQPGSRPLPHIRRGRPLFDPSGNPMYARSFLIFPNNPESCDNVFKNFLGETIVIDDMESATTYRRDVVQNGNFCPTILTRQGERVSARGKFGGLNNTAPPRSETKMFGAPPPPRYNALIAQIDMLKQYQAAVEKKDRAAKDYEDHQKKMESQETLRQKDDMRRKSQELQEVDRQLESAVPTRQLRRSSDDAGETSGIAAKRPRPT